MSQLQPLPPKKEVALALLERSSVFVHLDPRHAGVAVPAGFKKQAQLVLQIGLNMHVPIKDLRVEDDGISCTLSFNRTPCFCVLPWPSVFAMVDESGRGMVWPDDVPAEVPWQAQGGAADGGGSKAAPKPAPASEPKMATAKAKRSRKKPVLSAVAHEMPVQVARPGAAERTPPPPSRPAVPAAPVSRPGFGQARKKRELPPYLRVVK